MKTDIPLMDGMNAKERRHKFVITLPIGSIVYVVRKSLPEEPFVLGLAGWFPEFRRTDALEFESEADAHTLARLINLESYCVKSAR